MWARGLTRWDLPYPCTTFSPSRNPTASRSPPRTARTFPQVPTIWCSAAPVRSMTSWASPSRGCASPSATTFPWRGASAPPPPASWRGFWAPTRCWATNSPAARCSPLPPPSRATRTTWPLPCWAALSPASTTKGRFTASKNALIPSLPLRRLSRISGCSLPRPVRRCPPW